MAKRVGIEAAAQSVGLSVSTIRRGYKSGRFPGIRSGEGVGKLLFDVEQLEEALRRESVANLRCGRGCKADEKTGRYT